MDPPNVCNKKKAATKLVSMTGSNTCLALSRDVYFLCDITKDYYTFQSWRCVCFQFADKNVMFSKEDNFSSFFETKEFGGEDLVYCEECQTEGEASSVSLLPRCEHILNWLIICVPGLTEAPMLPRRVRWCTLRRFWLFFSRDLLLTTEPSHISNQTALWTCRSSYQQRWVTETCEPRVCALQCNRLCPSHRTSGTNCMGWWITWAN